MNRRHFLDLGQAARAAGQLAGAIGEAHAAVEDLLTDAPAQQDLALIHVSRRAMATTFEVILPWGVPDATAAADEALELIERLERQLTVYREDSELSRLNRDAAHESVIVEERLYELLKLSR